MRTKTQEQERPKEWLAALQQDPVLYACLLKEAGGLGLAAHRLATARCRTAGKGIPVPTLWELDAAASEIVRHVPGSSPRATKAALVWECQDAGALVIAPDRLD